MLYICRSLQVFLVLIAVAYCTDVVNVFTFLDIDKWVMVFVCNWCPQNVGLQTSFTILLYDDKHNILSISRQ